MNSQNWQVTWHLKWAQPTHHCQRRVSWSGCKREMLMVESGTHSIALLVPELWQPSESRPSWKCPKNQNQRQNWLNAKIFNKMQTHLKSLRSAIVLFNSGVRNSDTSARECNCFGWEPKDLVVKTSNELTARRQLDVLLSLIEHLWKSYYIRDLCLGYMMHLWKVWSYLKNH